MRLFLSALLFLATSMGYRDGIAESPATLTGTFLDDPVQGLFYRAMDGSPSGYTDAAGKFNYHAGDVIQFYLGDQYGIPLGSAKGKSIITPIDLVPGANGPSDPKVNNIAYLLQLFSNGEGKIIIPAAKLFRQEVRAVQQAKPINLASASFVKDIADGLLKGLTANKPNVDPQFNLDVARINLGHNVAQVYFPTSLHATGFGMQWWFNRGIGKLIGKGEFDQLGCGLQCHAIDKPPIEGQTAASPACENCHETQAERDALLAEGKPLVKAKDPKTCFACHGRQGLEMNDAMLTAMGMPVNTDVHRAAGKSCTSCHTFNEIHGNGIKYNSMHVSGKMERDCTSCHKLKSTSVVDVDAGNAPSIPSAIREHKQHTKDIHCSSCHIQTVTTCYNCHLDSSKIAKARVFTRPFQGFVILANDKQTKKITPVAYMTSIGQGKTGVTFAPYYNHSVQGKGRVCADCHNNAQMQEFAANGEILVTSMEGDKLVHAQGVIPFVPNKMKFVFMDHQLSTTGPFNMMTNPGTWSPLGAAGFAQSTRYEFITPLTAAQIEALKLPLK